MTTDDLLRFELLLRLRDVGVEVAELVGGGATDHSDEQQRHGGVHLVRRRLKKMRGRRQVGGCAGDGNDREWNKDIRIIRLIFLYFRIRLVKS